MTHLKGASENPSSHWRVDLDQPGPSSAAGPMPTNVAAMKSMVEKGTTEVRWRGGGLGYRGVGYRGGRLAYRGGLGHRGLGYGLAARAIVRGAVARSAYYGGGYGDYASYS